MMNCNDMERRILLSDSGELSVGEEKVLNEHLAGCEECRAYRKSAESIQVAARHDLQAREPSSSVVAAIISAAEVGANRGRILQFPIPALRMLASAAALVLLMGGVMMFHGDGQSDRVEELSAIISVVSESPDTIADEDALFELADQLLILQGFKEVEPNESEDQFSELFPTVLRLRSTRVLLSKRCV